jgi:hypothetical protein
VVNAWIAHRVNIEELLHVIGIVEAGGYYYSTSNYIVYTTPYKSMDECIEGYAGRHIMLYDIEVLS